MDPAPEADQVVAVLPIHYSNALAPHVHLHQFPLLNQTLQAPPSAIQRGKRTHARVKPNARRLEIHVPVDTRPEVYNAERAQTLGVAQDLEEREKGQGAIRPKYKAGEEPRLDTVRLRSEPVTQQGVYMLGTVRDGKLHLHPISQNHQLRPSQTYLDVLSRKGGGSKAGVGSGSDSEDGMAPGPDDPAPLPSSSHLPDAKEVQVSARRAEDKSRMLYPQGVLTAVRREMLLAIRNEEEEAWQDLAFFGIESQEAGDTFETMLGRGVEPLQCATGMEQFLTDTKQS